MVGVENSSGLRVQDRAGVDESVTRMMGKSCLSDTERSHSL